MKTREIVGGNYSVVVRYYGHTNAFVAYLLLSAVVWVGCESALITRGLAGLDGPADMVLMVIGCIGGACFGNASVRWWLNR